MTQLNQKVLFVDGDNKDLNPIQAHLKEEGFSTAWVRSGEKAIEVVSKEIPAVIVLEIILPGLDGVETCHYLRKMPYLEGCIILFLTSRDEDYSQIAVYEAGADDFVSKPISPRVFAAKIKTLLKRRNKRDTPSVSPNPVLKIDEEKMVAIKGGKTIHWQNKEFGVLSLLNSNPGKVFTRSEIFNSVWRNRQGKVRERIVDVYIRRIREKIGPEHVVTVVGRGYKLVDQV